LTALLGKSCRAEQARPAVDAVPIYAHASIAHLKLGTCGKRYFRTLKRSACLLLVSFHYEQMFKVSNIRGRLTGNLCCAQDDLRPRNAGHYVILAK
jgi:hypothetical protein